LRVKTARRTQLVDVTEEVERAVGKVGISSGVCYVYVPHTTAGVTVNEHFDPDVATDLEASRLLYRRAAECLGTPDGPVAVAHAKRFCPDAALRAAIACSETLGAYGWLLDHPLARMIALAKMLQVVDGTAEIQRVVIGRSLSSRSPRG